MGPQWDPTTLDPPWLLRRQHTLVLPFAHVMVLGDADDAGACGGGGGDDDDHHQQQQPTQQWLAETPAKHPGTLPPPARSL